MLYLLFIEEKRKKREKQPRAFLFLGHTCLIGCAAPGFFWMLGAMESYFKSQSLNFICT
jgi:hypothetical protein